MKIDVDTKQRLMTTIFMILEFYKILMGTFLVVFVPQMCDDKICTMTQNFFNSNLLNTVGNASNFVTFSSVLTLYILEYQRENWCIKYLDIDDEKSTNNLDTEIEAYPQYKIKMNQLNKNYLRSVYISIFLMITNFIISGFTVYQTYTGPNSITSFVSFFMLVSMKLYSAFTVGRLSIKNERANSAYLKEPKTYNTIDVDFRIEDIQSVETKDDLEMKDEKDDEIIVITDTKTHDKDL